MAKIKKNPRTDAKIRADEKYEKKRSKLPRLSGYINDDENKLVELAAKEFGCRKDGIIGALRFWKKFKNKV